MMLYLNLFLIELIFVIGLDVLHFWDKISTIISRIITKGKVAKPFDFPLVSCSTCLSWWTNLIYIICTGNFSIINVAIIIVMAMFAEELGGLIFMLKSWIDTLINKITIK